MGHYLARRSDQVRKRPGKRFCAEYWTVDFPRPMMAALTVPMPRTLRVDLDFLTSADLAGLIWDSEDRWSHPLLAYETRRDYRGVVLSFEWASGGSLAPLDWLTGAVLTVEGRDEGGVQQTWYVRLWNYADGDPTAATIRLDFDDLRAGFAPGGARVPVLDIDRLFLSLVPQAYDGMGAALAAPAGGWVELRNLHAVGRGSMLLWGDAFLPEHRLGICSGYDDSYNLAPERLVAEWRAMGFRGLVTHYVGMSHFPAVAHAGGGRFEVSGGMCPSARVWHAALLRAMSAAGMAAILSLSFELFDAYAPGTWAQRDALGNRALTGWVPPSTLISPCSPAGIDWLGGIAAELAGLQLQAGMPVRFQVGEPWWWVEPGGAPCFYDAETQARWALDRGTPMPEMLDVTGVRSAAERELLDWLGARLAEATAAVRSAASTMAGEGASQSYLLFYAPQVLDAQTPDLPRANMPLAWAFPDWDVLQLEDYDFVTTGDFGGQARARAAVAEALGYPVGRQNYLAGFVQDSANAGTAWPRIADAATEAMERGVPQVFVWAWPQVARDGFAWTATPGDAEGESEVDGFHDVRFPLALGFDATGGPEFSTQVAEMVSGHEQRNLLWAGARLRYDAGVGVRSEADLAALLAFFRARRGQAFAFRFRDPIDWTSAALDVPVSAFDQLLGVGDGLSTRFALVKRYGLAGAEEVRRISRPVAETVVVAVAGTVLDAGWALLDGGMLEFAVPPQQGAEVRAGFCFDVPVRFASDSLSISLSGVRSGEPQSVPLVEVRE